MIALFLWFLPSTHPFLLQQLKQALHNSKLGHEYFYLRKIPIEIQHALYLCFYESTLPNLILLMNDRRRNIYQIWNCILFQIPKLYCLHNNQCQLELVSHLKNEVFQSIMEMELFFIFQLNDQNMLFNCNMPLKKISMQLALQFFLQLAQ